MPIALELREDKRVLYGVLTDPFTANDLSELIQQQAPFYEAANSQLHQILNVSALRHIPAGKLGLGRTSPAFHHPNRGHFVIVGAKGFVRNVADVMLKIVHSDKVHFFDNEADAWTFIKQNILDEAERLRAS